MIYMSTGVISSDEMIMRLIHLEYQNLDKDQFMKEVERIYIEEYGKEFPAEMQIFHSSESPTLSNDNSGYDVLLFIYILRKMR